MKLIPSDYTARDIVLATIFLNLVLLLFILIIGQKLPPVLPLLYSRPWGQDQLVPFNYLFLVPGISLLFLLINLGTAFLVAREWFTGDSKNTKEHTLLLLRILCLGSLFASILGSITILRIALIVS